MNSDIKDRWHRKGKILLLNYFSTHTHRNTLGRHTRHREHSSKKHNEQCRKAADSATQIQHAAERFIRCLSIQFVPTIKWQISIVSAFWYEFLSHFIHAHTPRPSAVRYRYDCVTLLFSGIVGFAKYCAANTDAEGAMKIVKMLNELYTIFDALCDTKRIPNIYKVSTDNTIWFFPHSLTRARHCLRSCGSLFCSTHPSSHPLWHFKRTRQHTGNNVLSDFFHFASYSLFSVFILLISVGSHGVIVVNACTVVKASRQMIIIIIRILFVCRLKRWAINIWQLAVYHNGTRIMQNGLLNCR